MKLNFFRQNALDILRGEAESLFDRYATESEPWLDDFFLKKDAPNYFFDSGIEVDDFELNPGDASTDAENAKILYNAFRGKINRLQATDWRLWAYMTHLMCWNYMKARWTVSAEDRKDGISKIHNRYLNDRAGYVRNGVARLFWIPFLSYDEDNSDPYEYMNFLLKRQDVQVGTTERSLGRAKNLILGNLQALKEYDNVLNETDRRRFFVLVNQLGGVSLLDTISREKSLAASKRFIEEILSLPKIENGKSILVRDQVTGTTARYNVSNNKLLLLNNPLKKQPRNLMQQRLGAILDVNGADVKVIAIS